ncbi:MAG: hypothetical protein EA402_08785 [Planctomycetota bacterium]|nr:MAG: hypothetical protein EA402_08785 [Planctomycetota bacterium]
MHALTILLIAGAVVIIALLALARLARSASTAAFASECEDFLVAVGARRCELAVGLLRHLQRVQPESELHAIWERIELPLVEALPDCPPELKNILMKRLDLLHNRCRNREYQRRIMTLRNSLVD